ncbi:MAG: dihydroorotase [Firmicutes bacterium]|nr:dihydroorotase [Bacillota bacterium]
MNTPIRMADARSTLREACSPLDADARFNEYSILPGFTDVHVHLREPGFLYKETIATGTKAAAAGGFVHVLTMPNLDPVPDNAEHLRAQTEIILRDACIGVHPLGSLTCGEKGERVSDIEALAPYVAGFSDDGVGVMDDGLMREAMERVKAAGSIAVAHCEDTRFSRESREAEYWQLIRDLYLAEMTGCPYHMCHVSTRESVALIREAKEAGLDVTCETAPHYLTLTDEEIEDDGRFKMNPPIKAKKDRDALIEAVCDGTIDMIATDHAPHSAEEKSGGFAGSAYGIVGLETAFPVLYTKLVKPGFLPMQRLVELLTSAPNKRFGIEEDLPEEADPAPTFSVWDLDESYEIRPEQFLSKGKSTPFAGWEVSGRCVMTVYKGKVVYRR